MSIVYFADARARKSDESLAVKIDWLFKALGIRESIKPGETTLVKIHMGAPLCTRYLRPFYVRRVVERLKDLGAKPIVTDTTGLGLRDPRGTGEKYLRVAASHGFTSESLGAPILIADGENGDRSIYVEVEGHRFKSVPLAALLKEADWLINLTHFKGHHLVGLGGSIKNLAVGLASKEGKFLFHYLEKPRIDLQGCDGCGTCEEICPVKAIKKEGFRRFWIDPSLCIGCRACMGSCPKGAIKATRRDDITEIQLREADMAAAVVKTVGKDRLFNFNFLLEIDWMCDCEHMQEGWSDLPIVPDIGLLASRDPVAIDVASVDLVNRAPGIPGSRLEEVGALERGVDKFRALFPKIDWKAVPFACEALGIGSTKYRLVKLDRMPEGVIHDV